MKFIIYEILTQRARAENLKSQSVRLLTIKLANERARILQLLPGDLVT